MKYEITESQYKKLVLSYLNSVASDFIFEDVGVNWVDVLTSDNDNFGSVWFKTIQNRGMITEGCYQELSLYEDFTQEFEQTIPIIIPKVFSQVVLEYFNSNNALDLDCDCIEFKRHTGKYTEEGDPLDEVYRYDAKQQ